MLKREVLKVRHELRPFKALSSGKIDIYGYLTGEEILPFNQSQIIEKAKFTYSPLEKAFEKQTIKETDVLKSLNLTNKIDELNK